MATSYQPRIPTGTATWHAEELRRLALVIAALSAEIETLKARLLAAGIP